MEGSIVANAWALDLSGHVHKHRCPQCGDVRWHQGTKAECLDRDWCSGCDQEMQDLYGGES